jgi:hypothetical protein
MPAPWHRRRPGTWLVLNPKMTRVLGAGPTPERAAKRAGIELKMVPASEDPGYGRRPVLMQVPPPGLHF